MYLFLSTNWFSMLVKRSIMGVFFSKSILFFGGISSCRSRWLSWKQHSLWITPMVSQSRRESAGGDGGLKISGSKENGFCKRRFETSFSFWVASTWVSRTLDVTATGSEAAKRILNSLSNESTAGPLSTVTSCRCRWASVHVRLQSTKTACYIPSQLV